MSFSVVELIESKRDGGSLTTDAIEWLIDGYTRGRIPDYQMSAMAMAILFNGLDGEELASWTAAMLRSGIVLDLSDIPLPKIDKHSTGGVGDKISIPLAPLVASCGVAVPMMSGRALAHTGGTLDKLESIPGFSPIMDSGRFREIVSDHGLVLAGQSESMAPADHKLYALRDATGTVPSIPLVSSSIMSKKLAEGLDGLVLDIKTGSGAIMRDLDGSRLLARTMVDIGNRSGVKTVGLITMMDQPLGREVGNANEIRESVEVLRGEGPDDVTELTLAFGEVMLELAGIDGGRERLQKAIDDGSGFRKLREVVVAQGGDPAVLDDPGLLDVAPQESSIYAERSGYVTRCDALTIGNVARRLGAGRGRQDDEVDHGVSLTIHAKIGDRVELGDFLVTARFRDSRRWDDHGEGLASAWEIEDEPPPRRDPVVERIDGGVI